METTYLLPETTIVVTATVGFLLDTLTEGPETMDEEATDVVVALGTRGDIGGGTCVLQTRGRGDRDLALALTPDGRLTSVSYRSVGAAARVVSTGVKVLAALTGVALRLTGLGAGASQRNWKDGSGKAVDPWERWNGENQELAARRARCTALVDQTDRLLLVLSEQELADTGSGAQVGRRRQLQRIGAEARAEVDKIDALFAAWRAGTLVRRTETWTYVLALDSARLRRRPDPASGKPVLTVEDPVARDIWERLRIGVEVGEDHLAGGGHTAPSADAIVWRVPRPVRLSIHRRTDEGAELVRSSVEFVVDGHSATKEVPLISRTWGEDSLEIVFGDQGAPVSISTARTSSAAGMAGVVADLPDAVVAGLSATVDAQAAVGSLRDAGSQRRLDSLRRRLESTQLGLQEKGLRATEHDFVRLERLKQQIEVAEAKDRLTAPSELEELAYERDLLRLRQEVEEARRL